MSYHARLWRSGPVFAFAILLALSLLAGCEYSPGGGTTLPSCTAEELVAPTNLSPGQSRIITTRSPDLDTLTWEYSGACQPSAFRVEVLIPAEVYDGRILRRAGWFQPVPRDRTA